MVVWQPNAVMIPCELVSALLNGDIDNNTFAQRVRGLPLPPFAGDAPATSAERPSADEVNWLREQLTERFPTALTPNETSVTALFEAAAGDRALVSDMLDIIEDYQTRARVTSVTGLAISQLKKANGDFSTLREEAAKKRAGRTKGLSFVDDVMRKNEQRIKRLPPKNGPNIAGVARLKALTAAGKENGLSGTAT